MSILLKRNDTPGVPPLANELTPGEIAINTADAALYTKTENGDVILLASAADLPPPSVISWSAITSKPSTFAPSAHTHSPSEITGTAVVTNDPRLSDNRDPNPHTHAWNGGDITNLPPIDNNADNWRFVAGAQNASVELISYSANYFVRVSEGGPSQTTGTLVKGPITITNSPSTGVIGTITFPDATVQTTAYTGLVEHTHATSEVNGLDSIIGEIQTDISALETGKQNVGDYALANHDHSKANNVTAIGLNAAKFNPLLPNPNGVSSIGTTAIGFAACEANTTGYQNTGLGNVALLSNTTGYFNSALGSLTMQYNTTGIHNTATGSCSLRNQTTAQSNSGFGFGSLYNTTTGSFNTTIGAFSLDNNTVGSNNVAIGYSADSNNTNYNNCIIIGSNAMSYRNGDFVLGSSSNPIVVSTTVGSNGSASALPGNPLGYLEVRLNGTLVKIPYYRN